MAGEMNYREMYFTLKNGVGMPAIGIGTRGMRDYNIVYSTVDQALYCGYRLFDTAGIFGNEKFLGKAFRELLPKYGLQREDIFITTKLVPTTINAKYVEQTFEKSLQNLNTDYIDLYLLQYPTTANCDPQSPNNEKMRAMHWMAISKLYDESKIKAIGVSNFNINHLMQLTDVMALGPLVNQVEWHPYYYKQEMLEYCAANNILIQAYSSLGGLSQGNTRLLQDPVVKEVAKEYEVSPTQILLVWSLQKGIAIIPKSTNPVHIMENIQLNFRISEYDMEMLDSLSAKNLQYSWDPSTIA